MGSHTRWRTTVLLNLASIIERADEQVTCSHLITDSVILPHSIIATLRFLT